MLLSVIINHYQTPRLLKECLESLKKVLPLDGLETEIIVTDSQSQPAIQKMLAGLFPEITLIAHPRNLGFGKIVNSGLKKAQGKFILILNADIVIKQKEAISLLLNYLDNRPEVGLAGPQLLYPNGQPQNSCFRDYTPSVVLCRRTFWSKTRWGQKILEKFLMKKETEKARVEKKPLEVDWLMGSALIARREAVEKVGLFDERFFMYFEDVDWCRRIRQAGYKIIYFPASQMCHHHQQASKKGKGIFDFFLSKYARVHLASALKYFWKWRCKISFGCL